jgi:hypothetical protein
MFSEKLIATRRIYPLFVLLLFSFWPLYLSGFLKISTANFNTITHYIPLRYNAIRMMAEGHLPLWNPHILSGIALVGDGLSNPFDPLNIVFIFFDPIDACGMLTSLQLFLSGLFMFLYLRRNLNLTNLSALLGGVLYIFNPVLTSGVGQRLNFVNPLGSFLWLPLVMLFLDRAMERESHHCYYYSILTGMILAFSFFCGGLNFVFFMAIFVALFVILFPAGFFKKSTVLGTVGLIAILLSAIQLFPTLETASQGHRTFLWGNGLFDKSSFGLPTVLISLLNLPFDLLIGRPNALVTFLSSNFKLNLKEYYIGLIDFFLLSLIYLSKAETHRERIFKINTVILLFFLIGIYYLPLKGILVYFFPILKGVHLGYAVFLLYFCIIVLTAVSFNRLVTRSKTSPFLEKYGLAFKIGIFSFSLLIGVLFTAKYFPILRDALANPWITGAFMRVGRLTLYLATLCLSAFVIHRLMRSESKGKIFYGIILFLSISMNAIVLWEIEFFKIHQSNMLQKSFTESRELAFFRNMKTFDRVEIYMGSSDYPGAFPYGFNFPMIYNVSISGGSHQFMSYRYRKYYDMLNMRYPYDISYYWKNGTYSRPSGYAFIDSPKVNMQSLNLLGVKYIFSHVPRHDSFLKLIERGDYYYIYENLDVFPRCFIVHEANVTTPEDILGKLNTNSFNPLQAVLLEKIPPSGNIIYRSTVIDRSRKSRCEIIQYTPNEVVIRYFSPAQGFLVLTDAYDKGWKAYIDGKETEIFRANYLFRAVLIPVGEHTVRFKYLPMSFVIGAALSISTMLVSFVLLFRWRRIIYTKNIDKCSNR